MALQQQDSTEYLSQQIRFVSHEIRNHLSICDMYSQIIRKKLEQETTNNSTIDNAVSCIQKSLQIIGMNLADLKSLNINTASIFDFKTIVEKTVKMAMVYIDDDKNISCEVFIKNSANIKIDENRFISCLVNIIKNGIEAIEIKGKISVIGEIKDGQAVLKISNNGKVIPPDKQKIIFESGYTTKNSGSGFGLHICKKFLESQGSTIELVKSTKTETVFKISVPVV